MTIDKIKRIVSRFGSRLSWLLTPQKPLRKTEVASRNVKQNQEEQQREERSNADEVIFP